MRHRRQYGILLTAMLATWSCAVEETGARDPELAAAAEPPPPPPEPPLLSALVAVPVTGWTGPGGRPFEVASRIAGHDAVRYRQIGMKTFTLPLRPSAPTLVQYPCSSCHQGSRLTARRDEPAHENIRAQHPRLAEGVCTACHTAGAVDRLALARGETGTLDHPYRLCAQCHFAQVDAWAAGAHGKRLVAWGGRRVVMSCTDCHDPHRPELDPRIPLAGPRIRREPGAAQ